MDQRLKKAIEEGVAKGVPVDFIAYSLKRAGWPEGMVRHAIDTWLEANGRSQKHTEFGAWLKKYYKQAKWAVALMFFLNTIAPAIALLQPWPIKILANRKSTRLNSSHTIISVVAVS